MSPTETSDNVVESTSPGSDTCKREISIEIPVDVVKREFSAVMNKYQKQVRLPGFRKGHAPASLVHQRFADDIRQEILEHLLPNRLQAEAQKLGLTPLSQPQISDLHFHDDEPLRFKASFEVMPEFEVANYKGVPVEKPVVVVTDEQVEEFLNQTREQHATFVPVEDRAIADGDFAQVALSGHPKNESGDGANATKEEPISMDEVMVAVGSPNTLPEFSANLRGAQPGDDRTFDVVYPDDYSDEQLKGRTFAYAVKVTAIKNKVLPELDDDFAREISAEFNSIADVRQRIRANMEAEKKTTGEREAKDKLVNELIARHSFPIPDSLVEHQIDIRLDRGLRALAAQGMSTEQMRKMDFERLRAAQREQAIQDVRASLIIEKIANAENIVVTDDEVEHEVENVARQARQPLEAVRKRLTDEDALDKIRDRIRSEKTVDFVYQQSA